MAISGGRSARMVCALVVAALVAVTPAAATAQVVSPTTTSLLPALLDSPNLTRFDPSSPDACTAGRPLCVQNVIKEMTKRSGPLIASCDHNAAFSLLYLRVTQAIRDHISADPALFQHADFITHQDNLFAGMYWRAYDRWKAGKRAGLPGAWLVALDAARSKSMPAIGDLYLGINAHVLADLPVLLYQLGLADENGDSRKPDHDAVNVVLRDVFEPAIHELAQRLDPTMSQSDPLPWTTTDGDVLFQALAGWREQAWREAEQLAAAPDDATRQAAFNTIENYATTQALALRATLAYPPLLAGTQRASRYAYCMAHH
jgi:Family of unknown function (DUF5995)